MLLSNAELSKHRKFLRQLLNEIEKQVFFCTRADPLIRGVASTVYRRCGKKKCKCLDDDKRHGPYKVIQIYENKKQRQVSLKKEQQQLWQQARNYQAQINSSLKLKKTCRTLLKEVDKIIEKRLVTWEEACKKK